MSNLTLTFMSRSNYTLHSITPKCSHLLGLLKRTDDGTPGFLQSCVLWQELSVWGVGCSLTSGAFLHRGSLLPEVVRVHCKLLRGTR